MGRWLRHRPGGVGLRSERSGITGAMGPSMSWDPWPARSRERLWVRMSVHRSAKMASRRNQAHTQNALFRDVARPECAFP